MKLKTTSKKSSKVIPMYTPEEISRMASTYSDISEQIKMLTEEKKELANKIKAGAEEIGVKDDKGSYYFEDENFTVGKVASKSMSFDQDKAVKYLIDKKLTKCVSKVTIESVNEKELEKALADGSITLDEVEDFTNVSTSYKVSVVKKSEMPIVEQTKISAKRKK